MAKVSLNYSEKQDEVEIKGSRIDENQFNLILSLSLTPHINQLLY